MGEGYVMKKNICKEIKWFRVVVNDIYILGKENEVDGNLFCFFIMIKFNFILEVLFIG